MSCGTDKEPNIYGGALPMFAAQKSVDFRNLQTGLKSIIDSQVEDFVQTNGYASGAIQKEMDRIVGPRYHLNLRPDYEALGISADESHVFSTAFEREFSVYANAHECWVDAARKRTFTQLLRECSRSDMLYGECFLLRCWRPSPIGFSTCFQLISPNRISNPNGSPNTSTLRNGVELNEYGEETGYWIRNRQTLDAGSDMTSTWQYVAKRNQFGVEQLIHVSDQLEADQTRGISRFVSVLAKLQQLGKYEGTELSAAELNAMLTMVITSSDPAGALTATSLDPLDSVKKRMQLQTAYYNAHPLEFQDSKVPVLLPGEKLEAISGQHSQMNFKNFRDGNLFHVFAGLNMSFEEGSGDFTQTTYSSARASFEIGERGVRAKRVGFVDRVANKIKDLFAYEALLKSRLPALPVDLLADWRLFDLAFRANWYGPQRVQIDPVKAANAETTRLNNGTTTLSAICADSGQDWVAVLEQRAREFAKAKELGLPLSLISDLPSIADDEDKVDPDTGEDTTEPEDAYDNAETS